MKTKKNSVVTNYIYNTSYQILLIIAPLITTPYVSRVLGATGIGIYNYGQSIATYFVYIGAVGTTIYGQREIAYVQDDPEKRSVVFWEIVVLKLITVTIATVLYFLMFGLGGEYVEVYRVLTLEVIATMFDISWFFMGMEQFRITVIRNMIIKLIGIALIFVLVKSSDDVVLYTLCLTLPTFVGNISLWVSLPKYVVKTKIHLKNVFQHLKPSIILFIPQLATEIYAVLDKTMLGALATDISQVGYYSEASRIVKLTLHIVTSLGTVMLPAMAAAFAKGQTEIINNSIQKAFRFVYMVGFAIMFGICAVAKNFVPLFFGPGFESVISLMIIISPILIIIGTSNVIGRQYLLPTKQERAYTISVVTGAVVNVIANFILIPRLNAVGASIGTVLAELSVTGVQIFLTRKQLDFSHAFRPAIRYFIYGAIMFAIVYLIGEIFGGGVIVLIAQIAVGVIVYLLELLISKDPMLYEGLDMVLKKLKVK